MAYSETGSAHEASGRDLCYPRHAGPDKGRAILRPAQGRSPKLRALLYQRFAQRLRSAGDAIWTKE
jgi:hypothetical protein